MKCKNIECDNSTINDRKYCSLKCRNVYVNKYLRKYDKLIETNEKNRKDKENEYLENPIKCLNCNLNLDYKSRKNKFCSNSCSATYTNKNKDYSNVSESLKRKFKNGESWGSVVQTQYRDCVNCGRKFSKNRKYCSKHCQIRDRKNCDYYQVYRRLCDFKFNLNDYKDEFDFSLIEKHGWYSPSNKKNNLGGISRDHMISVREGFESGILPYYISHPANCRLMIHNDNISKNKKSTISIDDLLERIKIFEIQY
jgi:hypothetical protein